LKNLLSKLKNKNPHIAIIGDLILDKFLFGDTNRISPEAPVQVVNIKKEENLLGGAGNVANNLIALGSKVSIFSVIGNDKNGEIILNLCKKNNIDTDSIVLDENRPTTEKTRILASSQQIVRADREIKSDISSDFEQKIITLFEQKIKDFDVVIISDYAKGVLTNFLTQKVIQVSNSHKIRTIVDPKGTDFSKYNGAFLIKPNKKEASLIVDSENIDLIGEKILNKFSFENLLITLSEDGMKLFTKNNNNTIKIEHIPTVAKEVFDVTGAGDTAIASLSFALASDVDLINSMKFANTASGIVIGKVGTSTVNLNEILEYESSISHSYGQDHIKTQNEILDILNNKKSQKIVFTNGCFDILHIGHVQYLEKAKSLGDILIVGVNSDDSVRRLKGENRPINTQNDRAYLLGSLEVVDYVVIFEEDTPLDLIKIIKPDILVKGADYKNKKIVGSEIAKEVKLIDFVNGKSTTNTINKILKTGEQSTC
jgi:D-beta-D-heptose 7-phosphate kinase/D-beta-D-heptose 1-phosphate adenosyltransferase